MRQTLSAELVTEPRTSRYAVGDLVEVIIKSTKNKSFLSYLGRITDRPEDRVEQTTSCVINGQERVIPHSATYTLETEMQSKHIALPKVEENDPQLYLTEVMPPTTLVFYPEAAQITMYLAALAVVPQPRYQ